MTRSMKREELQRRAMARRAGALARVELREPSVPRRSPAGPTSFPLKEIDPDVETAIAAFLARKGGTS